MIKSPFSTPIKKIKLIFFKIINLGKVSKKNIKKLVEFSTKGGGGQRWVDFPLKKEEEKKGFITLKII